ncbi:MAG TPA: HD domain-containing protein [Candidatus Colwellbacteria bacterium]|nr:HD domain-containing protein [Candidatus Colwellbacteria bacterium]
MNIPAEVSAIIERLEKAGFKAYVVGGSVRDFLLGKKPKDWDVATDAAPEEIQEIFKESVYENTFGTVGVKTGSEDPDLKVIEVTTFRIEGKYSDKRHPDKVKFAKTIEEDLARRDFTINAMAMSAAKGKANGIIDPFEGEIDLKKKIIRTVGDPDKRFEEDALRLMRAVRFSAELGFEIETKTFSAMKKNADLLESVSEERIRDEFEKIIMSERAAQGVELLEAAGLLRHILPELREGIGVGQNKHHIYSIWEHSIKALDYAAKKNYSLEVRLAALLHDIGKPDTKRGDGPDSTFYNHEMVGAKIAKKIMERLKFPKKTSDKVVHLVRHHLFYYNVDEVTPAGVRRFIARVGEEHIDDLLKLREADRIGSGVPKAVPYKTRHLLFMIDKVKRDPISPKMIKLNGSDLMDSLRIEPGPRIGWILNILLEEVLDNPELNVKSKLEKRAEELNELSDKELAAMADKAKEAKQEFEEGIESEMKKRHYVK